MGLAIYAMPTLATDTASAKAGFKVDGKKILGHTAAEAVAARKKSYHSNREPTDAAVNNPANCLSESCGGALTTPPPLNGGLMPLNA